MEFRFEFFNILSDILTLDKDNSDGNINLENIRDFWINLPKRHAKSISDASLEEYKLYGKVLMLWAFGKCSPIQRTNKYPVYFVRDCRVSNPQNLHISLIQDGYLSKPTIYEILHSNKMQDLKIIAESIGCSKGGSKNDIVRRIADNLNSSDKENYINQCKCYSLSDKGSAFLDANLDLVELHRHSKYGISLSEFFANRFVGNRKRTFYDNAYHILTNRIYKNCKRRYYVMLQHDYRSLYDITLNESRYELAIEFYLRSLYIKTCCMFEAECYSRDYYSEPNFSHTSIFTTSDAVPLSELGSFYHPNIVLNIYNDLALPPSFLSAEEFCSVIFEMISEATFDFEKYNKLICKRLSAYAKR